MQAHSRTYKRAHTPTHTHCSSGSPEVDEEGVLQVLHDLQLFEYVPHFVPLHTLQLVHVLHGVHLLGVLLLHNAHLEGKDSTVRLVCFIEVGCLLLVEQHGYGLSGPPAHV